MVPIWVAAVFFALMVYFTGQAAPRQEAATASIVASVSATNMLAYRNALSRYLGANPGASGVIQDDALESYWLPGYKRNPLWTNLVQGGQLYVYASGSAEVGTVHRLAEMTRKSFLVGTKSSTTGRLVSSTGLDTGISLPTAIPDGAVVIVGT